MPERGLNVSNTPREQQDDVRMEFLLTLRRRGISDQSVLIITADHGDSFAFSNTEPPLASIRADEYGFSARISGRARSRMLMPVLQAWRGAA